MVITSSLTTVSGNGFWHPTLFYAPILVLLSLTGLVLGTLLLPRLFYPASRVISWILNAYLQFRYPIRHADTGSSIPGPLYSWPDGQGDTEKYVHGRDKSEQWQAQYGNVYRIWAGMTPEVVVTRPEQLHLIFKDSDQHKKATNSDSGYFMSRILGQCLGLMAGERWKFLKGITAPPFMHPAAVKSLGRIRQHIQEHFHELETTGDLRVGLIHPVQDLKMLPFFIVAESHYGSLTAEMKAQLSSLAPARENLMKHVLFGGLPRFSFSRFLPTEANRQLRQFQAQWHAFNQAAYERAREKHPLALVVQLYDAARTGSLTEAQVEQTLDETLYANLDVTTGGLSWNLVFLAAHPACQAKLYEEISVLAGPAAEETYLSRAGTYLAACVLESSRLRPALPFSIPQAAPTERVVDGYRIPGGTNYVVDTWGLNVRNEFWAPDAGAYRPERFLGQHTATELRYHFWRFGFGPRQCIGKYTADLVIRAVLLHLVQHYELQMAEDGQWAQDPECWITHPNLQVRCVRREVPSS